MRELLPPRYVDSADELAQVLESAKQRACPHCGRAGALNGHGVLRGYSERTAAPDAIRGRRLFCSNRRRRPGCGRTCSVPLANRIRHHITTTRTLVAFVVAVTAGATRRAAWLAVAGHAMSLRSGYRLWARLARALPALRTLLHGVVPPPACSHVEPLAQLLAHVELLSTPTKDPPSDPFAALQLRFQRGLFD